MVDLNDATPPPATIQGRAAVREDCNAAHVGHRRRWLVLPANDPSVRNPQTVGGMTARKWRRLERRAWAARDEETLSAARRLTGVLDVVAQPSATGVLRLRGAGGQLSLVGAAAPAWLQGSRCRLDGAGRYGPWWWVRLSVETRTVSFLGSNLRVASHGGGDTDGRHGLGWS